MVCKLWSSLYGFIAGWNLSCLYACEFPKLAKLSFSTIICIACQHCFIGFIIDRCNQRNCTDMGCIWNICIDLFILFYDWLLKAKNELRRRFFI